MLKASGRSGYECGGSTEPGRLKGSVCKVLGGEISDVPCEADIWRHVAVIIFSTAHTSTGHYRRLPHHRMKMRLCISNSTLTLGTHTWTCLTPILYPPRPRKQGVSCPLLFLPAGAESLWKLLVNGHLVPPPTACHHLLSRHYSGPLRRPHVCVCVGVGWWGGGVVNRSGRDRSGCCCTP